MTQIKLNQEQEEMLAGEQGVARQMGMRLLLDMAAAANASELVPISTAHLAGVSPLTGGLGLRQFLTRLGEDPQAQVAVPTTLNSAGCDDAQFEAMRIVVPNFREHNAEIVAQYTKLGVRPIQSCIPYEWEGVVTDGEAAWAESNAICFGNSYTNLITNRESGLSALAAALTGYTPKYGLMLAENRRPNLEVVVTMPLLDPADFSILGDWIGKQRQPDWQMPYGPIPMIFGLPKELTHDQKKALTAAAANYGSPLLYIDGLGERPSTAFQTGLQFGPTELQQRYRELAPKTAVSLITIGCPQASIGEIRATAELLKGKQLDPAAPPLWLFTSAANKAIAEKTGLAKIVTDSGALLLENSCPEVVPYDQSWVHHMLTNSMKGEHYIKSGLNGIPTSVMCLPDCVAVALGELEIGDGRLEIEERTVTPSPLHPLASSPPHPFTSDPFSANGHGLPSQTDFSITAEAFVTDTPITLLGFVNRESGVIEEPGHPANGQSMAGKIAIFPKGSGSTVAPYVLLELFYRGKAPLAIVNTEIDQQSAPACSLENIPYAYQFNSDIIGNINNGDIVCLQRRGQVVTLDVVTRRKA
jgi:phosphomecalonate degydratase large subunit